MTLAHKHDSAWDIGDFSYDLGDTLETGKTKAASLGIHPCSDEYAAFITAFGRRVRMKQVSPLKVAANAAAIEQPQAEQHVNGSSDLLRAAL
jgi:hypothetical protein